VTERHARSMAQAKGTGLRETERPHPGVQHGDQGVVSRMILAAADAPVTPMS
jgi:hypothetical protein